MEQRGEQVAENAPLGVHLRRARLARGLSFGDVAAEAGVSSAFLSKLEDGRTDVTVRLLQRICQALGIQPASVLIENAADPTNGCTPAPTPEKDAS